MSRNVSGQAYALTVLTPILDGHEAELTAHLDALPEGEASPLARVPGTHLGRWVVIDQVKYQGHGQRRRDSLAAARLLFTSNFDGELDAVPRAAADGARRGRRRGLGPLPRLSRPRSPASRPGSRRTSSRRRCSSPPTAARRWSRCTRTSTTGARDRLRARGAGARAGGAEGALPGGVLTALDFPNIQGFVVRGYRLPSAGYLFLRIEDAVKARAFLSDSIADVITAERWDVKPDSGINLAFSHEGLRALGVGDDSLAGFPAEFRDGMASRAELLGDVGESAPEHWEACFRSGDAHVLVMISAKDAGGAGRARPARSASWWSAAAAPAWSSRRSAACCRPAASTSATPTGSPSRRSRAAASTTIPAPAPPRKNGDWRPIAAGEFILGYPDEQGSLPAAAAARRAQPQRLLRRLPQAAPGRRRASGASSQQAAELYPGGEELLAAKLVGRWRDGTPLDFSPHAEDPALVADKSRNNAFDYGARPGGPALPGRLAHPPHEPAAEHAVRGQAREPPPPDPARDHLRRDAARGRRGRRRRARRDLHDPPGEPRPPVRVRPGPVGEHRQRVPARRGPGPDHRPAGQRRAVTR